MEASRRNQGHEHDRVGDDGPVASLEEEVGDQEAEQTQSGHDLEGHARFSGSMLLLHCRGRSLGLATCLPLPQSLICQSVLESLNLSICVGKLGLQFVAGGESAGHGGLGVGEGTGGFSWLGRFRLGLLGEIGSRNWRGLIVDVLLAGSRRFEVSTGGGVSWGLLIQYLAGVS